MNRDDLLNDFAIRSFRDIGDQDYIAARIAYRTKLFPQFLWSGLQAVEKYLKCILLLNRIKATNIKHDLSAALIQVEKSAPFKLRLSDISRKMIDHLDTFGRFRYFETPFRVYGEHIIHFDKAIWEIRRYCRPINISTPATEDAQKSNLDHELRLIEESENESPHLFKRVDGLLEKILSDKRHPARSSLIWQNPYFGTKARKFIKIQRFIYGANSPLALFPKILDDVQQYIFLPKDVINEYKKLLQEQIKINEKIK